MFKEVTIKLNDGVGLARLISDIIGGFEEMGFKLNYRLNRQLTKLGTADKKLAEAKTEIVKKLVTEKKFEKLVAENTPINEALTKKQFEKFNELLDEELQSEITVGLLSESFEGLIGDDKLPTHLANTLSAVLQFFEQLIWNSEDSEEESE